MKKSIQHELSIVVICYFYSMSDCCQIDNVFSDSSVVSEFQQMIDSIASHIRNKEKVCNIDIRSNSQLDGNEWSNKFTLNSPGLLSVELRLSNEFCNYIDNDEVRHQISSYNDEAMWFPHHVQINNFNLRDSRFNSMWTATDFIRVVIDRIIDNQVTVINTLSFDAGIFTFDDSKFEELSVDVLK